MNLPIPTELRHVYRSLLRAASYLPDSALRTYAHDQIVRRFRSVSDKINSTSGPLRGPLVARYHGIVHIRSVQQYARQLERAGQGSLPDLKRIVLQTYGRIGSRRRELLRKLLTSEEDRTSDSTSLEDLIAKHSEEKTDPPSKGKKRGPYTRGSKVWTFLQSQQAAAPNEAIMQESKIKEIELKLPEESIWGRPLPLKLQASKKRKHWKTVLHNILPPVPEHEWNTLRGIATGILPIEDPPLRRSRPSTVEKLSGEEGAKKLLDYFITPVDQQRMRGRDTDEVTIETGKGATYWSKPRAMAAVPVRSQQTLTDRYMRRLYASVWTLTSKMVRDEARDTWVIKWGKGQTAFKSGRISAPRERDLELFEGAEKSEVRAQVKGKRGRGGKGKGEGKPKSQTTEAPKLRVDILEDEGFLQGVVPVTRLVHSSL